MLKKQQKLNQYLESVSYVDDYYRQYVQRLNKKILEKINN